MPALKYKSCLFPLGTLGIVTIDLDADDNGQPPPSKRPFVFFTAPTKATPLSKKAATPQQKRIRKHKKGPEPAEQPPPATPLSPKAATPQQTEGPEPAEQPPPLPSDTPLQTTHVSGKRLRRKTTANDSIKIVRISQKAWPGKDNLHEAVPVKRLPRELAEQFPSHSIPIAAEPGTQILEGLKDIEVRSHKADKIRRMGLQMDGILYGEFQVRCCKTYSTKTELQKDI